MEGAAVCADVVEGKFFDAKIRFRLKNLSFTLFLARFQAVHHQMVQLAFHVAAVAVVPDAAASTWVTMGATRASPPSTQSTQTPAQFRIRALVIIRLTIRILRFESNFFNRF